MPKLMPWALFKEYLEFKADDHGFSIDKTNSVSNCSICKTTEHKSKINYSSCVDIGCNSNGKL